MSKPFLSAHEIATLFVVHNTPEQVQPADPEAISLLRAELVKLLPAASDCLRLATTLKGKELLRRFGMLAVATRASGFGTSEGLEGY